MTSTPTWDWLSLPLALGLLRNDALVQLNARLLVLLNAPATLYVGVAPPVLGAGPGDKVRLAVWLRDGGPQPVTVALKRQNAPPMQAVFSLHAYGDDRLLALVPQNPEATLDAVTQRLNALENTIVEVLHDLKTPLAVANTQLFLAERAAQDGRSRHLQSMGRQLDQVRDMLDDLMTVTGTEMPPMVPLDLRTLTERVVNALQDLAGQNGVRLLHETPPSLFAVHGNAALLERAVRALVENALRYTPRGGWVSVIIRADSGYHMLTVQDNGPGVPPEEQPHVFRAAFRGKASSEAYFGGHGLGLAIVARVAEQHGGNVTLETAPDHGSTFRLALPVLA